MSGDSKPYDAVVLGAGGLSIAWELTKRGVKVAVVARDLPEDVNSASFASPWAGANWAPYSVTPAEQKRDILTYHLLDELADTIPDIVNRTEAVYAYQQEGDYQPPWYKDIARNFRQLPQSQVPKGWNHAYGFGIFTINPPAYLSYLAQNLRQAGVPFHRARVSSLDEAYTIFSPIPVGLVINATALGSRTLLGVEDPLVLPARGQTVLVKAPNVRKCYSMKVPSRLPASGFQTYIIPRPGPEGHVILGGTFQKNRWDTQPEKDTAERILKEAYELCPDLSGGRGWEGIKVVSHNVGLRPVREGGMRLELERRVLGGKEGLGLVPESGRVKGEKEVGVVHAYGIGPAGYQSSHGIAVEAADLAEEYLGRTKSKL